MTWNGATPLMRAIESCNIDVIQFLLDCNVNMILANKKGEWQFSGLVEVFCFRFFKKFVKLEVLNFFW